jgi:hypothetical protein
MVLQTLQRRGGLSHYENLTSHLAFGSVFLKDFWEPTLVNVRIILLVEYDKTLYIPIKFETLGVFMCICMMVTSVPIKR